VNVRVRVVDGVGLVSAGDLFVEEVFCFVDLCECKKSILSE
jgi:hypothetical protein